MSGLASPGPSPDAAPEVIESSWELPIVGEPLARDASERAPVAALGVRLARAQEDQDWELEARLASELAQELIACGYEIGEALRLERRALLLGDNTDLRRHLAEWYTRVGKPAAAAATLLPLAERSTGSRAAHLWQRIAVWSGRAGDAAGAARAIESAAADAPTDPAFLELRGALDSTHSDKTRAWAVEGYLAASKL